MRSPKDFFRPLAVEGQGPASEHRLSERGQAGEPFVVLEALGEALWHGQGHAIRVA